MNTEYESNKNEEFSIAEDYDNVTEDESKELHAEAAKTFMAMNEDDFLKAILEASNFNTSENSAIIEVRRSGKVLFSFRIHAMSEADFDRISKKNTTYMTNRNLGYKVPKEKNNVRYRSQVIYEATIEEDRKKLWDNKKAWASLDVLSGIDMVDKVLMAGEKDHIYDIIEKESGFTNDSLEEVKSLEDSAKN